MDVCPYVTASHFLGWSGAQNWLFCLQNECFFSRNESMLTIRGDDTLPESCPTILIYLREVMRHSTNNGCLSFGHSITFPRLISCPKLRLFGLNKGSSFGRKDTVLITRGSDTLSEALAIILIYVREVRKRPSSSGCPSLVQIVLFPGLIWCPPELVI